MVSTAVFDTLAAVILLAVALLGEEICKGLGPMCMCRTNAKLFDEPCRIARPAFWISIKLAQMHETSLALQELVRQSCFMSGARRQAHPLAEVWPMFWATCSVLEVRACHACASAAFQYFTDKEPFKGFTLLKNLQPPCWLARLQQI